MTAMACAVCEQPIAGGPVQFYLCGHGAHFQCDPEYEDQERCPECARQAPPPPGAAPSGTQRCAGCGASLGTLTQRSFAGVVEEYCRACESKQLVTKMLEYLPEKASKEWEELNEWEQRFVPSVRGQVADGRTLSEKQVASLERTYRRLGGR